MNQKRFDVFYYNIMMMHKALHPRDETDYMCEERKEKGYQH